MNEKKNIMQNSVVRHSLQGSDTYSSDWVGVSRQRFQTLAVLYIPDADTLVKLNSKTCLSLHNIMPWLHVK